MNIQAENVREGKERRRMKSGQWTEVRRKERENQQKLDKNEEKKINESVIK